MRKNWINSFHSDLKECETWEQKISMVGISLNYLNCTWGGRKSDTLFQVFTWKTTQTDWTMECRSVSVKATPLISPQSFVYFHAHNTHTNTFNILFSFYIHEFYTLVGSPPPALLLQLCYSTNSNGVQLHIPDLHRKTWLNKCVPVLDMNPHIDTASTVSYRFAHSWCDKPIWLYNILVCARKSVVSPFHPARSPLIHLLYTCSMTKIRI